MDQEHAFKPLSSGIGIGSLKSKPHQPATSISSQIPTITTKIEPPPFPLNINHTHYVSNNNKRTAETKSKSGFILLNTLVNGFVWSMALSLIAMVMWIAWNMGKGELTLTNPFQAMKKLSDVVRSIDLKWIALPYVVFIGVSLAISAWRSKTSRNSIRRNLRAEDHSSQRMQDPEI